MLKATVSGSFHRHMQPIYEAVGGLREAGVDVLSPSDPRVVDHLGDFLFVASDRLRSVKLVQDRHLLAIRASDFLWVVCPDGYTGPSVSMEVGAAYAYGVPVFCSTASTDITLAQYITCVPDLRHVTTRLAERARAACDVAHVLIDPNAAIERGHRVLDDLTPFLLGRAGDLRGAAEAQLRATQAVLRTSFTGQATGAGARGRGASRPGTQVSMP